jgi:hypothetical protein
MKTWTKPEVDKLLAEIFDPNKVTLICGKHQYAAGGKVPPTPECRECAQAFFTWVAAKIPPHKRAAELEKLLEFAHTLVEHEDELSEIELHRPDLKFGRS